MHEKVGVKMYKKYRRTAFYAITLGTAYIAVGASEFALGLWNLLAPGTAVSFPVIPVDLFGGLAATIIGATYLGAAPVLKGKYECLGFILVGAFLSAAFGALYLLIVGADGFGTLLAFWEGQEWTWEWLTKGSAGSGLFRPEIWLSFPSLPLAHFTLKISKGGGSAYVGICKTT